MSPQASPTIQRAIRKVGKQAPIKPGVEQTADPQPAPLAASDNGDNLEARIRVRASSSPKIKSHVRDSPASP